MFGFEAAWSASTFERGVDAPGLTAYDRVLKVSRQIWGLRGSSNYVAVFKVGINETEIIPVAGVELRMGGSVPSPTLGVGLCSVQGSLQDTLLTLWLVVLITTLAIEPWVRGGVLSGIVVI
jgi:hypothetical protein